MKNRVMILVLGLSILSVVPSLADDRGVAQCVLSNGTLSVLATTATARGNEFFRWDIPSVSSANLVGDHDGSQVMNLLDQALLPRSFKASVAYSDRPEEVTIDIKGCDLSNLTGAKNFRFICNVIAY